MEATEMARGKKPALPEDELAVSVTFRLKPALIEAIDEARNERPLDPLDRSAMIRQLILEALEARGTKRKGKA